MYLSEQTKEIQNHTRALLKTIDHISADQVKLLREVLHFHEYRYYIMNDPLISDFEYDQLYKALETIEKENPELITSTSPTQRVAKGLTRDFPTVQHLVPMLSLENSYDAEDLLDWDRKARELSGLQEIEYCVEPKFDGASNSLIYENDVLVRGATRGNGVEGDDVTANILQIRTIPLHAKFSSYGISHIEVRGEVLMNKNSFKKYNDQLAEHNLPPLANQRNSAVGSLRIKDPNEVKRRNLEAFIYHVSYFTTVDGSTVSLDENKKSVIRSAGSLHEALKTHAGTLEMLWNLGFKSPMKERRVLTGIQQVIDFCPAFEAERDNMPYEI